MAGRFRLVADEHWSKAHIKAARDAGWDVVSLATTQRYTRVEVSDLQQVIERAHPRGR